MGLEVNDHANKLFDNRYEIVSESGCWIWTAATNGHKNHNYGVFAVRDDKMPAHRYSAKRFLKEKLLQKDVVIHRCDVPECVNPEHLRVATQKDNMQDMHQKKRANPPKGERHHKSNLSEEKVLQIFDAEGSYRRIAKLFGTSATTVSNIKNRKTWFHVTSDLA